MGEPEADIVGRIKKLASQRSLEDLTSCLVLTWNNERFLAHVDACLKFQERSLLLAARRTQGTASRNAMGQSSQPL